MSLIVILLRVLLNNNFEEFQKNSKYILKCICIESFDNFFIGQYERLLKTGKKAFYCLLISVSVPEI